VWADVASSARAINSMRVWSIRSAWLAANDHADVIKAISEQNLQVAAGSNRPAPVPAGTPFLSTWPINTQGRLLTPEQFEEIIVKTVPNGQNVYLKVWCGSRSTTPTAPDMKGIRDGREKLRRQQLLGTKDNRYPPSTLAVFQLPGSNAIATGADAIKAK